jgi:hypothetical protein
MGNVRVADIDKARASWRRLEGTGCRDRCTMASPTTGGSINEVGWRFQSFRINDLEMVDQNSASWNQIAGWLRQLDLIRTAA